MSRAASACGEAPRRLKMEGVRPTEPGDRPSPGPSLSACAATRRRPGAGGRAPPRTAAGAGAEVDASSGAEHAPGGRIGECPGLRADAAGLSPSVEGRASEWGPCVCARPSSLRPMLVCLAPLAVGPLFLFFFFDLTPLPFQGVHPGFRPLFSRGRTPGPRAQSPRPIQRWRRPVGAWPREQTEKSAAAMPALPPFPPLRARPSPHPAAHPAAAVRGISSGCRSGPAPAARAARARCAGTRTGAGGEKSKAKTGRRRRWPKWRSAFPICWRACVLRGPALPATSLVQLGSAPPPLRGARAEGCAGRPTRPGARRKKRRRSDLQPALPLLSILPRPRARAPLPQARACLHSRKDCILVLFHAHTRTYTPSSSSPFSQ